MKRIWGLVVPIALPLIFAGQMVWYTKDAVDQGLTTWARAGTIVALTMSVVGMFLMGWLGLIRGRSGISTYIHTILSALFCLGVFSILAFGLPLEVTRYLLVLMKVSPGGEFGIFVFLFVQAILVTFLSGWVIRWSFKVFDEPTEKGEVFAPKFGRMELFHLLYFTFYLLLLLVSGYLGLEHKNAFGLSEDAMAPAILGFATYIVLDRVLNAARKVKEG